MTLRTYRYWIFLTNKVPYTWPRSNPSCTLCLFHWKTFCKDNFSHFPVFGSTKKKTSQRKTIFSQWKILIKIRLIFYMLFSKYFCGARELVTLAHFTLGLKARAEEKHCRGHTMKVQIALRHSRGWFCPRHPQSTPKRKDKNGIGTV